MTGKDYRATVEDNTVDNDGQQLVRMLTLYVCVCACVCVRVCVCKDVRADESREGQFTKL